MSGVTDAEIADAVGRSVGLYLERLLEASRPPTPDPQIYRTLLSVKQLAEAFALSDRTIYRMAREGELACVREGRRVFFEPDVVAEWAREHGRAFGANP